MRSVLVLITAATLMIGCAREQAGESVASKTVQPAPKPAKPWAPDVFDPSLKRLPIGYAGTDIKRFFSLAEAKVDKAAKGEFETTANYEKRTADADGVLSPISTNSEYAFLREPGGSVSYNADKRAFESDQSLNCYSHLLFDALTCKIAESEQAKGTYTGSNAFGAEKEVDQKEVTEYYLVFEGRNAKSKVFTGPRDYPDVDLSCPVPIEKAKLVKKQGVRMLIVGRMTAARHFYDRTYETPTYGDPRDVQIDRYGIPFHITRVVCFAQSTGEILNVTDFNP